MSVKRIDHIAIVVPDIDEAQVFYRDVLGLELAHIEQIDGQEVIVAFFPVGGSEVELLKPTSETSGVARYLANRGPGIHHLCLEVDDLQAMIDNLKERGVQLINEQPTIGNGGKKVVFVHPKSTFGVLIELVESTREKD